MSEAVIEKGTDDVINIPAGTTTNGKIIAFLMGLLIALAGAYIGYPKNLVTQEYLDLRMGQYESAMADMKTREIQRDTAVDRLNYEMGRVEERQKMAPQQRQ